MKKLLIAVLTASTIFTMGCGKTEVKEEQKVNITKGQVEDEIEKIVEEQEEEVVDKFTIEDSQAVVSKYSDIINAENFHLRGMVNSELEPITLHTDGNERNFLAYRFLWEHDGVTDEIYLISDGHDFKYGDRVILDAYKWFGEDDELGKFMVAPAGHEEAIFISFF